MCVVYSNFHCIFKYQVNEKLRIGQSASAPDLEIFPSASPLVSSQAHHRWWKAADPLPHRQPQEKQREPCLWDAQLGALVKQAKGL